MFKEFDNYLSSQMSMDYWHNEASDIAEDMIDEFEMQDWEILINELPSKSIDYKKKLAYCINDNGNPCELSALMCMLDTDNDELLLICIGSLVYFLNTNNKKIFLENDVLLNKIDILMSSSNLVAHKVCENF